MQGADTITWRGVEIASSTNAVVQFDQASARMVESVPLIGSKKPKIRDRQNTSHQFVVGVLREHPGASSARQFMLDHAKNLQGLSAPADAAASDLEFSYSAGGSANFTLNHAVLNSFQAKQIGVSTLHTYTFTGEEIA